MNRYFKLKAFYIVALDFFPVLNLNCQTEEVTIMFEGSPLVLPNNEYILIQSTGILDKNGVEIFEEDVVEVYDPSNSEEPVIGTVQWNDTVAGFEIFVENSFPRFLSSNTWWTNFSKEIKEFSQNSIQRTLRVIGNSQTVQIETL